jgi:hypothetical protein
LFATFPEGWLLDTHKLLKVTGTVTAASSWVSKNGGSYTILKKFRQQVYALIKTFFTIHLIMSSLSLWSDFGENVELNHFAWLYQSLWVTTHLIEVFSICTKFYRDTQIKDDSLVN